MGLFTNKKKEEKQPEEKPPTENKGQPLGIETRLTDIEEKSGVMAGTPTDNTKEPPKQGIVTRLSDIETKINEITDTDKVIKKFKKKSFKMPFKVKSQLKKMVMKNKVLVIYLKIILFQKILYKSLNTE